MLLRCVRVDALCRRALGIGSATARPLIGRALLRLGFPVVPDLLEAVLERAVGHAMGALPFAIFLDRRVVSFGECALRLGARLLQRARQLTLLRVAASSGLR